jgi:hypothetical protein
MRDDLFVAAYVAAQHDPVLAAQWAAARWARYARAALRGGQKGCALIADSMLAAELARLQDWTPKKESDVKP